MARLTVQCTIAGAPWGPDAELHIVSYNPWFELVNGDGVTVTCGEQNKPAEEQAGGEGEGEGEGEAPVEGEGDVPAEGEDEWQQ